MIPNDDKENQETKSVIAERDTSLIKKSMRGNHKYQQSTHMQLNQNKNKLFTPIYGSKNYSNGFSHLNRHSVNLMTLNSQRDENRNPNKSVLDFIDDRIRKSQRTNDFWTLSKDSSQLDIKKKNFRLDSKEDEMSVSFRISEAFRKVNEEGVKELDLSNLGLTDKDINKYSKRFKALSHVKTIKFEKNKLTGKFNKIKD